MSKASGFDAGGAGEPGSLPGANPVEGEGAPQHRHGGHLHRGQRGGGRSTGNVMAIIMIFVPNLIDLRAVSEPW